jgi:hypothetical protein
MSYNKVRWATSNLSAYKSPGRDGIFLKTITGLVMQTFRASTALGYVPLSWRAVIVIFLQKPGCTSYLQAKSFCPTSLTSFLLKTLESLVDRYVRDGTFITFPSTCIPD